MKIKQFLFLLILYSLIVPNFTHPMDNSPVMTYNKKKQTLMTELGVKCWEVIWKNHECFKPTISIPKEAYSYCEAGYKNSKISIENIRNNLDDYSHLCGLINLDSLTNEILGLPNMFLDEAMTIAKNMKIDGKVAQVIVDNFNPEYFLLNEKSNKFSLKDINIVLLKKTFYHKMLLSSSLLSLSIIPKKVYKDNLPIDANVTNFNSKVEEKLKLIECDNHYKLNRTEMDDNTKLASRIGTGWPSVHPDWKKLPYPNSEFVTVGRTSFHRNIWYNRNGDVLNSDNMHILKESLSSRYPAGISSDKRFMATFISDNEFQIFGTCCFDNQDYLINKMLLKIYLEKEKDEVCNIYKKIGFRNDSSVLYLKNSQGAVNTVRLPMNLMKGDLSLDQLALFYCLKLCEKKEGYSGLNSLRKLLKSEIFKKLPLSERTIFYSHFNKVIEKCKFIRAQYVENAIFTSECSVDKEKRTLSFLVKNMDQDQVDKINICLNEKLVYKPCILRGGYIDHVPKHKRLSYLEKLNNLLEMLKVPTHITKCKSLSREKLWRLSYFINGIVENLDDMNNKSSKHNENTSWTGHSYVEGVENSTEQLNHYMSIKKLNCTKAIEHFCKSDDLDKLYETISRAMIPKPLALQIRKKINKRMQSESNNLKIDSEDDQTDLSKLVESFHTHCKTNGKPFAEELSSCFDLANKKIVSERFRSQLGL